MTAPLPSRRDEAWRYADLKALETVWSQLEGPEHINVPAGETLSRQIAELPVTDGVGMVRRIQSGRTTVVETVRVWEPGVALRYEITGLPPVIQSVTNTWSVLPHGHGTKVDLTTEIDAGPRPPQQGIAKLVGRKLGEASDQMLSGLAVHLARQEHTA